MGAPERIAAPRRPQKSPSAFRTISEVSSELDVPQHVLRFWETKFAQLRPLKRGGGRRYYRPEDVELLGRIRELLYRDGYTIKGVQRLFRTEGTKAPHDADADPETQSAPTLVAVPAPPTTPHNGSGAHERAALEGVLRELLEIREILRARAPGDDA
jgi:DNA-binding transcriptional MerR regulator